MTSTTSTVRRAWPRDDDLVLELVGPAGAVRAGVRRPDGTVELHPPGSDPGLVGLAAATGDAGGSQHVVAHRLGRRAVVRDGTGWVKVVRPSKLTSVVDRHRQFATAVATTDTRVADIIAADAGRGTVLFEHLDGRPMLDHTEPVDAAQRVAAAVQDWWRRAAPPALPVHDAAAECAVLDSWAASAARHRAIPPSHRAAFTSAVRSAQRDLAALRACPYRLAHRDLHDGQLLVCGDRVAVLDLDTAARADPALDIANLLAHVDLAAALGRIDEPTAAAVAAALARVLDGPAHSKAVDAYRAAARVRLVAVHAFRPGTRWAALTLLEGAGP